MKTIICKCGKETHDFYVTHGREGKAAKLVRTIRCAECHERAMRAETHNAVYGSRARVKMAWRAETLRAVVREGQVLT